MQPLRVGINLASLRLPLKKGLTMAARLGADAVEIDARREIVPSDLTDTALRQIRKMLDDLGLKVAAVRFATQRGYNETDDLDRRVDATKAAMKMAYDLRASCVVNYVGRIPTSYDGPSWDLLVATLSDLAGWGQKVGTTLAARTGPDDPEQLLHLIEEIRPSGIGIDFDPASLIMHNHTPLDAAQLLAKHVVHVHARDGVRDFSAGRGLEVALGRGTTEFPVLAATLGMQGYHGYFTVERTASDVSIDELGQAVTYLKSIVE